jgi:DNA-binding MarR family transcriptional regulator
MTAPSVPAAPGTTVPWSGARTGADDGLLGGIVRLNLVVTRVLEDIAGAHGLTMADYLVLGVVRGAPGSRSAPTAIADTLGRTTGGMTLALDRLVQAGWVRRSPDPEDGRRVVVELTAAGLDLALAINAELHEWESGLVLPGARPDVVALVDGLTAAVEHHHPPVRPV